MTNSTTPKKPKLAAIVAHANDLVIGRDGQMPWHLPADLKYFKACTLGSPVVMGRKTLDSIGRLLPGRDNLIVSGHPRKVTGQFETQPTNQQTTESWWQDPFEAASAGLKRAAEARQDYCFVIGGGGIYEQLLPYCEALFVTQIDLDVAGDTFFPSYASGTGWQLSELTEGQIDERNAYAHRFAIYTRSDTQVEQLSAI
ncbi:dihydrofolate reductase [Allohahella marinimesophila]|uniref:dihydrofolate reductase n=1 Tax=Allohahella marinimesophila TaxID=1054972 RepID=A0ABP7NF51_9GAMM